MSSNIFIIFIIFPCVYVDPAVYIMLVHTCVRKMRASDGASMNLLIPSARGEREIPGYDETPRNNITLPCTTSKIVFRFSLMQFSMFDLILK